MQSSSSLCLHLILFSFDILLITRASVAVVPLTRMNLIIRVALAVGRITRSNVFPMDYKVIVSFPEVRREHSFYIIDHSYNGTGVLEVAAPCVSRWLPLLFEHLKFLLFAGIHWNICRTLLD
uniref:Secreted protein n=1 Tax=Cacopsylla melanoneura TaxID=428564 RepID=A0A8D9EPN6_9HEMI